MTLICHSMDELDAWHGVYGRFRHQGAYHDPDYMLLMARHFYPGSRAELVVMEQGGCLAYYPYLKRPLDGLAHLEGAGQGYFDIIASWYYGGPLLQVEEGVSQEEQDAFCQAFRTAMDEHCRDTNIVAQFIRFDPNLRNHEPWGRAFGASFERETVYLDLTRDEETIWKEFEVRNRTAIRKAVAAGITVERAVDMADLAIFAKAYDGEMERKHATSHYWFRMEFFQDLWIVLGDRFQLFVCRHEGTPIGGGMVVRQGGIAHNYLMANDYAYWVHQPNNHLLHQEQLWCKAQGDTVFDLQGGRPGVFKFKKSFSATRGHFHTSAIVNMPEVYEKLVALARANLPGEQGTFFPAYRPAD